MTLGRKHGWLLLAVAAWNVVIWLTFAKNLYAAHADGEDRATAYWVAHSVLIVVDLVIAVVLARLGLRLVSSREPDPEHVHQSS
jgi:hypothetical protein